MADATADQEDPPKKKGLLIPLLIGLVLAGIGGGVGYIAVTSGMFESSGEMPETPRADVVFVPLEPLVISMGDAAGARYLRFRGELEVLPEKARDVQAILPRITDVLNGYLRAIETRDVQDPASLMRLRAQMLRRIQIITGDKAVSDLLVIEFVLQ